MNQTPANVKMRPAEVADALAIADVHATSWRSAYRGQLSDEFLAGDIDAERRALWTTRMQQPPERQHIILAEQDDHVIGFACVYGRHDDRWGAYLNNLHVLPAHQGLGLGSTLLRASATQCLHEAGDGGMYLWVVQANHNAQRFYANHGAKNVEASMWNAPGGTTVPLYRFAWDSLRELLSQPSRRDPQ